MFFIYCVKLILHLMASGEGESETGVLAPMPCPHNLPTLLDMSGVTVVPYQLMEDQGWAVDLGELHQALKTAKGRCQPRAIYISNPGNPTGKQHAIATFAHLPTILTTIDLARSRARQENNRGSDSFYSSCWLKR